jgi:hypothetical protein
MTIITRIIAIAAFGLGLAILFLAPYASAGERECFDSLKEARAAHPTGHLTWSGSPRCYSLGHAKHTKVARVPLPRVSPRPAAAPAPAPQLSRIEAAFKDVETSEPADVLVVDQVQRAAWRIKLKVAMGGVR